MGDFFNSQMVKTTMNELAEMQEKLIQQVLYIPYMTKEQKKEHIQLMKDFLEKQKILFFRMTLSDDPEAKDVQKEIMKNAQMFGILESDDTEKFFNTLDKTIDGLAKILDM